MSITSPRPTHAASAPTAPSHNGIASIRAPRPADLTIDERFTATEGSVYLTGIQALVRMIADRARYDRRTGLRTGSFVSGYEGSPLAGYDLELERRANLLRPLDVVHRPGLNEELAATSVMGSQLAGQIGSLRPDADGVARDGVVGYWYGKAPGLDRATDALRHANLIGTHPDGGAIALVGDDPGAKSSTVPCASEMALADLYMPIFYPADSQDVLELGLHAALMSRTSGLWTAMKVTAAVADGGSTVTLGAAEMELAESTRMRLPNLGGLGRSPHVPSGHVLGATLMELEQNQLTIRIPRALEYARLNRLNRVVARGPSDRIGIAAAGKTYLDVREALRDMGIEDDDLARLGIRIYKISMVYPMERESLYEFVDGLDEVIVVEEKRDFIETMMREHLYLRPGAPRIVGKAHEDGSTLFSRFGELDIDAVTRGLATRLSRVHHLPAARAWLDEKARVRTRIELPLAVRTPYYCSGCPHNSSTKVAEGTLVGAGIGCHAMVLLMDERQIGKVTGTTQMGGEGAQWIGMAPFLDEHHLVQNIGDGTYAHSGSLAVRATIAAGVNITYKLLYNGTVAMTGGQDKVGDPGLARVIAGLLNEGVKKVVVTSDDPKRTRRALGRRTGVDVRDRAELADVQRELAEIDGVTVLVHDQHCAAEKRRGRKRGTMPTPTQRVMINERICEGCGDCGKKSNCLSVHPVDTEYGRKTQIDQSSCNLDFSCLEGDCPSFVTVTPAATATHRIAPPIAGDFDVPERATRRDGFRMRITGIGGTGVVTTSQVLATAAALDGLASRTVDMTGLAQKGGAVVSDLKVSATPLEQAAKVATGDCDLYLACDGLVGTDPKYLKVASPDKTLAVVATTKIPTGAMVIDTSVHYPTDDAIVAAVGAKVAHATYLDPCLLSTRLFGSETYSNMIMVGAAFQTGALPIHAAAIEQAIDVNGVAVGANVQAFRRGRQAVADPDGLKADLAALHPAPAPEPPRPAALRLAARMTDSGASDQVRELIAHRADELIAYQDEAYAARYVDAVAGLSDAAAGDPALVTAAANGLFKLLAYKDEYEVARLTADPAFARDVAEEFGSGARTSVRLHPPALRALGMRKKIGIGDNARATLTALAALKRLRGTRLDPFGRTEVRRTERALAEEYLRLVGSMAAALRSGRRRPAELVALAELPDVVRGYEDIKLGNVVTYRQKLASMRAELGV